MLLEAIGMGLGTEVACYAIKLIRLRKREYVDPKCGKAVNLFKALPTPLDIISMEYHWYANHKTSYSLHG